MDGPDRLRENALNEAISPQSIPQGLNWLRKNSMERHEVSGHDFSRAENSPQMNGLYRLLKKSQVSHCFSTVG